MTDCGANWHAAPMSFADHRAERAANVAFREGLERRRRAEEEVVSAHSRGTAALAAFRAGSSGDFLTLSPPAEKANARQDQAGQASTGDGGRNADRIPRNADRIPMMMVVVVRRRGGHQVCREAGKTTRDRRTGKNV